MMETQTPPNRSDSPGRGRLIRPHDANWIAGVAVGLARWLDIPVWFARLLFALAAFAGGLGFLLYAAGWLLIPREGEQISMGAGLLADAERGRSWTGIVLIAVAAMIVTAATGVVEPDLMLAAILLVVGVIMYRGRVDRSESTPNEPTTRGGQAAGEVGLAPVVEAHPGQPSTNPSSPLHPPRRERRQPPSTLGRWTWAMVLTVLGVTGLVDAGSSSVDLSPRHYLAATLTTLGTGLLVGALYGRARGLVFLGVVLIPAVILSPIAELNFEEIDTRITPTSLEDVESVYDFEVGMAVLDLRSIEMEGKELDVSATLDVGELVVLVPDGVAVNATSVAEIGEVETLGRRAEGIGGITVTETATGSNGTLTVHAEVTFGRAAVAFADDSGGSIEVVVSNVNELDDAYFVEDGDISLDLGDLTMERPREVTVSADMGTVRIVLPRDVQTEVSAAIDGGSIVTPDGRSDGPHIGTAFVTGPDPILKIEAIMNVGQLIIEEAE